MNFLSPPDAGKAQTNSGFTLIEVVIAFFVMSLISIGLTQAVIESAELREKIRAESHFYNGIRFAMEIVGRDISMLYTPKPMIPEDENEEKGELPGPADSEDLAAIMGGDAFRDSPYWGPVVDKTGIRLANFVGFAESVNFISAAHVRMYAETPESVFSKVMYELRADEDVEEGYEGTFVLVRRFTPNAFDLEKDEDDYTKTYEVLDRIKSFKLEYYDHSRERWESKWDTQSSDFKGRYPDAVRVTLEVLGDANRSFEGTYVFKPEIPFNGLTATF